MFNLQQYSVSTAGSIPTHIIYIYIDQTINKLND